MCLRLFFVLFIGICLCYAAPTSKEDAEAKILEYENENDGYGNYHFRYVTSNGIKRDETGTLINSGQPNAYIQVEGIASYINETGEEIFVKYTADDQGYHVSPLNAIVSGSAFASPGVSPLIVASLLGAG